MANLLKRNLKRRFAYVQLFRLCLYPAFSILLLLFYVGVSGGVFTFSSEFGKKVRNERGGSVAKFRCELCGAEQFTSQGSLNLHKYHCKYKRMKKENECKEHEWRLLNPHNPKEQRAMSENYMEVCSKCQILR